MDSTVDLEADVGGWVSCCCTLLQQQQNAGSEFATRSLRITQGGGSIAVLPAADPQGGRRAVVRLALTRPCVRCCCALRAWCGAAARSVQAEKGSGYDSILASRGSVAEIFGLEYCPANKCVKMTRCLLPHRLSVHFSSRALFSAIKIAATRRFFSAFLTSKINSLSPLTVAFRSPCNAVPHLLSQ